MNTWLILFKFLGPILLRENSRPKCYPQTSDTRFYQMQHIFLLYYAPITIFARILTYFSAKRNAVANHWLLESQVPWVTDPLSHRPPVSQSPWVADPLKNRSLKSLIFLRNNPSYTYKQSDTHNRIVCSQYFYVYFFMLHFHTHCTHI